MPKHQITKRSFDGNQFTVQNETGRQRKSTSRRLDQLLDQIFWNIQLKILPCRPIEIPEIPNEQSFILNSSFFQLKIDGNDIVVADSDEKLSGNRIIDSEILADVISLLRWPCKGDSKGLISHLMKFKNKNQQDS